MLTVLFYSRATIPAFLFLDILANKIYLNLLNHYIILLYQLLIIKNLILKNFQLFLKNKKS
jgi:hypothetical protein